MTPEEQAALAATPRISHVEATALAFSPDGSLLAVGTNIGQVKLFKTSNGELSQAFDDRTARLADKETPESWKEIARADGKRPFDCVFTRWQPVGRLRPVLR